MIVDFKIGIKFRIVLSINLLVFVDLSISSFFLLSFLPFFVKIKESKMACVMRASRNQEKCQCGIGQ